MSLELVKQILQASPSMSDVISWEGWEKEQAERADKVRLCREYADGEHRAKLTDEMKAMLRIDGSDTSSPFNVNHMDNIIQTLIDRLDLTGIEGDNEAATKWIQEIAYLNRIDGLQLGIHESAAGDGDTYLLCEYNNDTGEVEWKHEPAYDGTEGMIVVYGNDQRAPLLAIKIWRENITEKSEVKDKVRINVYYPDKVQKYIGEGKRLEHYEPDGAAWEMPWAMQDGSAIGVPVVPFSNKAKRYSNFGKSEIDDVITVQDALNRTLVSMVMSAELSGFMIRYSIGMKPPAGLTPGMWLHAFVKGEGDKQAFPNDAQQRWLDSIRFGVLEAGELAPYLAQAQFLIDQMYIITRTPRPEASGQISGEALKQLEAGLLGKVRRAHVNFGNAWEAVAALSWRIQSAYGQVQPPAATRWYARWKAAEIRDDAKVIDNAIKVVDQVDERTFLQLVAPVFGWDTEKIDKILENKRGDAGARLAALAGNLTSMNGFNLDN